MLLHAFYEAAHAPWLSLFGFAITFVVALAQFVVGCMALSLRFYVEVVFAVADNEGWSTDLPFGYCPLNTTSAVLAGKLEAMTKNEKAMTENLDLAAIALWGALTLLNLHYVWKKTTPVPVWPEDRKPNSFDAEVQLVPRPRANSCVRRSASTADMYAGDMARWKIAVGLGFLAVLNLIVDALMYICQSDHCFLNRTDGGGWKAWLVFRLLCCSTSAWTQGMFQCELMSDMSRCKLAIVRLKEVWAEHNAEGHSWIDCRTSLETCRTSVQDIAKVRCFPLSLNIAIHGAVIGICAAQIVLNWFFYNHRTVDNQVMGYAVLGLIYAWQLFIFLPRLCSINDHADELIELVMTTFEPPTTFNLHDLKGLAETCPVSFPVMGYRLSTAKISGALVAVMASILGLGLTTAKLLITDSGMKHASVSYSSDFSCTLHCSNGTVVQF